MLENRSEIKRDEALFRGRYQAALGKCAMLSIVFFNAWTSSKSFSVPITNLKTARSFAAKYRMAVGTIRSCRATFEFESFGEQT